MLLALLLLSLLAAPSDMLWNPFSMSYNKWQQWTGWSHCSVTCGRGHKQRRRICILSQLARCGKAIDIEKIPCKFRDCPKLGAWTGWSACDATCGEGYKSRQRPCDTCSSLPRERQRCNNLPKCPIDGGWALWAPWSDCSTTCENGTILRQRSCTNPRPQHGGRNCIGTSRQTQPCVSLIVCPVDGAWSSWSNWTTCSKTCGHGTITRKRTCNNPAPTRRGRPCAGPTTQTNSCSLKRYCGPPVNGEWGPWSWCTKTCDTNTRIRKRYCDFPAPANGGRSCPGSDTQTSSCSSSKHCFPPGNFNSLKALCASMLEAGGESSVTEPPLPDE